MSETRSAVVVGAGIVGAACAQELALAGFRVTVVDEGPAGSGATAAGMGHLVVMDDSPAQLALTHYSRQLWDALELRLPRAAEFERTGTLWIAADDQEMAEVERKQRCFAALGIPVQVLGAAALAEREPHLRAGLAGGLLVPSDAVVYPPTIARWMLHALCAHGQHELCRQHVTTVEPHQVLLSDGTRLTADVIVNAAGADAARLTPGLPLRPRKGHLAITERYPGLVRHQLIELGYLKSAHSATAESVAFNVQPRATGQLLIGSSRQFGDTTATVHAPLLARMLVRATEYLPGLARRKVLRVWTGFRAATFDKLPLIGPVADQPGVYLATGHEGLGITTSLGTARLLVDQIVGRPSAIACEPYLPSRFASAAALDPATPGTKV